MTIDGSQARGAVFVVFAAYRQNVEDASGLYAHPIAVHFAQWTRIAALAERHSLDPTRLVNSQFARLKPDQRVLLKPHDVAKDQTLALQAYWNYDAGGDAVKPDWSRRFDQQLTQLRELELHRIPDWYSTVADVLLDPNQPFEPWFRVGILAANDRRVVDRYGQMAANAVCRDNSLAAFVEANRERLSGLQFLFAGWLS